MFLGKDPGDSGPATITSVTAGAPSPVQGEGRLVRPTQQ